jgi:hypothetical protein
MAQAEADEAVHVADTLLRPQRAPASTALLPQLRCTEARRRQVATVDLEAGDVLRVATLGGGYGMR